MEVTRRWRRRKKLLDDLKDRRGYCQLKEEALDRTMCRNRFGRGFGPVVWQITDDDDTFCIFVFIALTSTTLRLESHTVSFSCSTCLIKYSHTTCSYDPDSHNPLLKLCLCGSDPWSHIDSTDCCDSGPQLIGDIITSTVSGLFAASKHTEFK